MNRRNLTLDDLVSIENKPITPTTTSPLTIDPNITPLQGEIAYLGTVSFADGEDWVGVRLTGDSIGHGRNDGTVRGRQYFKRCGLNGGLFVRAGRVKARTTNRLEELRLKKELKRRLNRSRMGSRASGNHRSSASLKDDTASVYSMSSLISGGDNRSRLDGIKKRLLALTGGGKASSSSSSDGGTTIPSRPSTDTKMKKYNDTNTGYPPKSQSLSSTFDDTNKHQRMNEKVQENIELQQSLQSAKQLDQDANKIATTATTSALQTELFSGDDGVDGSSIVSLGITTADKEEEFELNPGNDVFNSNVNASNESNCEETAKNLTATPMETPEEKTKRLAAMKISKNATFEEMDKGYHHTTKWTWIKDKYGNWNYSLGKETTVYVKMDQPRSCSYQKWNDITKKYESIVIGSSPSPKNAEPRVELNGITLRQLRAIMANIKRRCLIERWVNFQGVGLDPNEVNLYDADHYVIRPYTVHTCKSLVARLPSTAGPQQPRFFVSHWWGGPVYDFINCVEQLIRDFGRNKNDDDDDRRGGGMTADTPIWVCAYANNQWDLKGITVDPRDSGFTKAMKEAEGRTLTILDTEGIVFTRIWCVYELYLTLIDSKEKGLWAVYTAKKHTYINPDYGTKQERESVGIISGGSTSDGNNAYRTTSREKHFPYNVISKALNINVENAKATVNDDRVHILNSIIGKMTFEIDDTPPKEHHKYTELNESLKSIFAASQASLQGAAKDGDEEWMEMLVALSNGTKKDTMDFDFGSTGEFSGLTATRAIQLMSHLPLTIKRLDIFNAEFGSEFMEALIKQVEQFENLEWLWICDTLVGGEKGGQEAGVRLAKVLATNTTIKSLNLWSTDLIRSDNVVQWGDALMENKTLTRLALMGVDGEIEEKLRTKTKDRTPNLTIEADGADGVDESSTVSIGITTVDKEEEPESGAANDVSNSTFNARYASNSEEPAKNATATPMEATYSQASLQGAAAHLSPSVADSDFGSESDLDTTHNGEGILNAMVLNNEGAEKHCKEVEMDQENGDIKVGKLRSELVGVRESVTIAEVHAEVESNSGDNGVDGSSTVSIGITTADKEEESELGPGNDVFNSNVNASNESNCEESAKNLTATPMETANSQTSLQGAAKGGDKEWMEMLVALSNGTKKDDMTFDFGSTGGFSGLTATRAIQLMSHLPLTIKRLDIFNAEFGSEFMEALIKQVEQFENLEGFAISDTLVGGEKGGQEAGVRLAKVLSANTTIKILFLYDTDLIGIDNVVQWGDTLIENKTLTYLSLAGVDEEIKWKLRTKIKDRTPNLIIK